MYVIFLALLGLPILICEFSVGRASRKGIGKAFDVLEKKGTHWHHLKWMGIIGSYILMMFYTMVGGWMLYYAYLELSGKLAGLDAAAIKDTFNNMLWYMCSWITKRSRKNNQSCYVTSAVPDCYISNSFFCFTKCIGRN